MRARPDRIGWSVAIAVILFAASCDRAKYEGSTQVADGIHLRLHALGEGEAPPTDSDSVFLRVRVAAHDGAPGSLFSTERWFALTDTSRFRKVVLGRMVQGDSVSVIAEAGRVPWTWICPGLVTPPPDTTTVDMELRILEVMTPAEARAAETARRAADPDGYERRLLQPFIASPEWTSWGDLVYYRIDRKGLDTTTIQTGDMVSVHYQGRFTDGKVFDDTRLRGQPLTFRLGDPDQVIQGIEMAVHQLHKGGRGTFAFRSSMAFGAKGSSSGSIPPYTPVVYEVEVMDLHRRAVP